MQPAVFALLDVPARLVVLQFAEMPGERELFVIGEVLVAEHQHGILIHAGLDCGDRFEAEWTAAVDPRNLGCKCRMQLAERYGHVGGRLSSRSCPAQYATQYAGPAEQSGEWSRTRRTSRKVVRFHAARPIGRNQTSTSDLIARLRTMSRAVTADGELFRQILCMRSQVIRLRIAVVPQRRPGCGFRNRKLKHKCTRIRRDAHGWPAEHRIGCGPMSVQPALCICVHPF